jgi:citronellol/citronellal dehydrogenase
MERLGGKTVIVTGGTMGIGEAIVRRCAHEGAGIVVVARNAERGRRLAGELGEDRMRFVAGDVTDSAVADSAVEAADALGGVDVLVNNAAITFPGDLDMEMKRFDLVMQVDMRAPMLAINAAVVSMKERGGGAIVNVSSVAGLNYIPGLMAYGMAKAALEHLTVSAAHQLREFDIAVNTFRIDVPVASEGFVFNMPDADHSDWEPSEVAAEGIVWMVEQPPSYTGHNAGMARLRAEHGIMPSRASRHHRQQPSLVTETHLRPLSRRNRSCDI